jgi:hypothetical protein
MSEASLMPVEIIPTEQTRVKEKDYSSAPIISELVKREKLSPT